MAQLHLSTRRCTNCGEPMVEEWVGYWLAASGPRHASCEQYTRVITEHPDRFATPIQETQG